MFLEKNNLSKTYFDLAELVEHQGEIINQQSETIARLINESAEQENMINVLLHEES